MKNPYPLRFFAPDGHEIEAEVEITATGVKYILREEVILHSDEALRMEGIPLILRLSLEGEEDNAVQNQSQE